MPITTSAKKALRQSRKRREKNLKRKKRVKTLLKDIRNLSLQKKTKEAQNLLSSVYKELDKAAKTGLIKKNTAARKKSEMAKLVNTLKTPSAQS